MRKRLLAMVLAVVGWAFSAPLVAQAQQTLMNTTISITGKQTPNPRGTSYNNTNLPLNLVAGTTYDFRVAVATQPAYAIDPYIYLLSPSGTVVGEDDANGLGLGNPYGSFLQYTPTTSGNFTLVVTTFGSGSSYPDVPITITTIAAGSIATTTSITAPNASAGSS